MPVPSWLYPLAGRLIPARPRGPAALGPPTPPGGAGGSQHLLRWAARPNLRVRRVRRQQTSIDRHRSSFHGTDIVVAGVSLRGGVGQAPEFFWNSPPLCCNFRGDLPGYVL